MDEDDFLARVRYLLVVDLLWKAIYYLDRIELESILFRKAKYAMDENYSNCVKNKCQKIIKETLLKNIKFVTTKLTYSVNVFAATFQSVLEIYPDEAYQSELGDENLSDHEDELSDFLCESDTCSTDYSDQTSEESNTETSDNECSF